MSDRAEPAPELPPRAEFATTRWTRVLRARGDTAEARAVLSDLCAAYYAPVEGFLRWRCGDPEVAREHAQEFFARLLAAGGLTGVDPARGRFRSYLLGAVKHYLQAEEVRRGAAKRGGGRELVSLEAMAEAAEGDIPVAGAAWESAEGAFDRHWAQAVLERALRRLETELCAEGKGRVFEVLKPTLQGAVAPPPQAELAAALGLGSNAVKVMIHRLRRRFREAVRAEIADTLSDPEQVGEELQHLLVVLGRA